MYSRPTCIEVWLSNHMTPFLTLKTVACMNNTMHNNNKALETAIHKRLYLCGFGLVSLVKVIQAREGLRSGLRVTPMRQSKSISRNDPQKWTAQAGECSLEQLPGLYYNHFTYINFLCYECMSLKNHVGY